MKAGWLFSKRIGDGTDGNPYRPSLDAVDGTWTSPGDIVRFTGPVSVPHVHHLVGGLALQDDNLIGQQEEGHRHYLIRQDDVWHQITVGAQNHTHTYSQSANGDPVPDYYLVFWHGSDSDAAILVADSDNFIVVQAVIDQDGNIGELDNTPWTAQEQTLWESRMLAILGIQLPVEVDRGKRLISLVGGALLSRSSGSETNYRPYQP